MKTIRFNRFTEKISIRQWLVRFLDVNAPVEIALQSDSESEQHEDDTDHTMTNYLRICVVIILKLEILNHLLWQDVSISRQELTHYVSATFWLNELIKSVRERLLRRSQTFFKEHAVPRFSFYEFPSPREFIAICEKKNCFSRESLDVWTLEMFHKLNERIWMSTFERVAIYACLRFVYFQRKPFWRSSFAW